MKNGQALLALVLASCAPYRYGGECWPVNAEIELVSSAVDKRRALTAETMRSLGIVTPLYRSGRPSLRAIHRSMRRLAPCGA